MFCAILKCLLIRVQELPVPETNKIYNPKLNNLQKKKPKNKFMGSKSVKIINAEPSY